MAVDSNIVVFNYALDVTDPLLSHQYEAVKFLASVFSEVTVVTGRLGDFPPLVNVSIYSTCWEQNRKLLSLFRLLKTSIPVLVKRNYASIFFHMTDLQAAILGPIIWILRKPQFLWYAHVTKSRYLTFASLWVSKIVTSTIGSCPIRTSKVLPIGQAIDNTLFPFSDYDKKKINRLIHVGRFDKSKNVDQLITAVSRLRVDFKDLELLLIGSTANQESKVWAERVVQDSSPYVEDGWLKFGEAIPKIKVSNLVREYGVFLHKYEGSLDKTIIESTLLGIPVVTTNPEYLSIFGSWGGRKSPTIGNEYRALVERSEVELRKELGRRAQIAVSNHTLEHWGKKMTAVLSGHALVDDAQSEIT